MYRGEKSILILLVSFAVWFTILLHWIGNMNSYAEKRGMYRILWARALTNISVVTLRLL